MGDPEPMTDFMEFFSGWLQSSGIQNLYHAVETNIIRAAAFRHTFIDGKTVTLGRNLGQFNCQEKKKEGRSWFACSSIVPTEVVFVKVS